MKTVRRVGLSVALVALVASVVIVGGAPAQGRGISTRSPSTATVPWFGWRGRAKYVVSDVVNASLQLESYYAAHNVYPITKKAETAAGNAFKVTTVPGDQLTIVIDQYAGYCVFGTGKLTQYTVALPKVYDSALGGLRPDTISGHAVGCSGNWGHTYTLP